MKKILSCILIAMMCVSLFSCTENPDVSSGKSNEAKNIDNKTAEKFVFELNGVSFSPNDNTADFISKLGEPASYFESESCAFQGLDKVYTYSGIVIRTYPKDNADYVLNIELKDDSVSTPEGAFIGDSVDTVKQIYGTPDDETPTALIYKKDATLLYFTFADDTVTAITYTTNP